MATDGDEVSPVDHLIESLHTYLERTKSSKKDEEDAEPEPKNLQEASKKAYRLLKSPKGEQ